MNRKNNGGFTLVEVLAAMLIFLVIVFPFLSAYIMSGKMNRQSFYMKRAVEVVDMAGNDISNWDYDILETICQKDDNKVEWKYLNTTGELSMYEAFRQLLDDDDKEEIDIKGKAWGDNLDIYFKVEKEDDTNNFQTVEDDELRGDYNFILRVEQDGMRIIGNSESYDTNYNNNDGRGYYLKVTLNNGSYSCKFREIPNDYMPLEKINDDNRILFGGKEWKKLFLSSPGDVALIYCPSEAYQLEFPFDTEGNTVFRRGSQEESWGNIASYLNNEFYNSLIYNTNDRGENYKTSKEWIKKHVWNIGDVNNEVSDQTTEYVGLLSYSELSMIKSSVSAYLYDEDMDSYTLTPSSIGTNIKTLRGEASPTTILRVNPVIYLDKNLYCCDDEENYRLYDCTSKELKEGSVINTTDGNKSQMKMMIYFDKSLSEDNSDFFEKLRLLVDVEDNRSTKTNDGLVIYTINNKKVGNYSWLNVIDATRRLGTDNGDYRGFRLIDSVYLDKDYKEYKKDNEDTNLRKVFSVNGYKVTVWAEYLNPDEYRGSEENEYLNEHEKLEIHINKEKDRPTFEYKKITDTDDKYNEVDNIRDTSEILEEYDDGVKRDGG